MKTNTIAILAACLAIVSAAGTSCKLHLFYDPYPTRPNSRFVGDSTSASASAGNSNGTSTDGAIGTNLQAFTGTLGGAAPPVIETGGDRPFTVNGDTFVGKTGALGRSCDVQHNACANAANSGTIDADVSECDDQNTQCHAANNLKKKRFIRSVRPKHLSV